MAIALLLPACGRDRPDATPRHIQLDQTWQLQPGDAIAGYSVRAALGDIAIDLHGNTVYAPMDGDIHPTDGDCVLLSSPEIPAYLFRFCGLRDARLGSVQTGDAIGKADLLAFSALRKQPAGTWVMVEPSTNFLARSLHPLVATQP
jgi:hypothetical protein